MLKGTLNSSLWLICTKNLYSDGDELSVVDCTVATYTVLMTVYYSRTKLPTKVLSIAGRFGRWSALIDTLGKFKVQLTTLNLSHA